MHQILQYRELYCFTILIIHDCTKYSQLYKIRLCFSIRVILTWYSWKYNEISFHSTFLWSCFDKHNLVLLWSYNCIKLLSNNEPFRFYTKEEHTDILFKAIDIQLSKVCYKTALILSLFLNFAWIVLRFSLNYYLGKIV